jgi:hypothetical protein
MENISKIEVHIISWTGKHQNAINIAEAINCADKKIIIYSDIDDIYNIEGDFEVVRTNNELYWGDKFKQCVNIFKSDVLLIIHADCKAENWNEIVMHCKNAYESKNDLGLWAPLTYGTAFPVEITAIDNNKNAEFSEVNYIDGIVFSLNSRIIERMKCLDYSKNIYGWGIDWFAASVSFALGFRNEVDKTVAIHHPVDRGYKSDDAKNQMRVFMNQLTSAEEKIYKDINKKVAQSRVKYLSGKNKKTQVNLYQSFYADDHRKHLSSMVKVVNISGVLNKKTREYELFKHIYKNHENNKDAWGLISWKFDLKNVIKVEEFYQFATEEIHAGADCVFINPMIGNEAIFKNVWEHGLLHHKEMNKIVDYFQLKYGQKINGIMGSANFAFCNYFVAKPVFWVKYFQFIDKEMSELYLMAQKDEELAKSVNSTANYSRDALLSMNPFIIERLFSLFVSLNQNQFKIMNFRHDEKSYVRKFGERCGLYLWRLKVLKEFYLKTKDERFYEQWQKIRDIGFRNHMNAVVSKMDDPEVYLYK